MSSGRIVRPLRVLALSLLAVTGLAVTPPRCAPVPVEPPPDGDCPTAILVVGEGDVVAPQTVLHLYGDQSYAPAGGIESWEWTVEQPEGSVSTFVPSATVPNPTFEANVVGAYTFRLNVVDEVGRDACEEAVAEVLVLPTQDLHVELLWTTPADADPSDQGPAAGADLDLHLLHANAPGDPAAPDVDGDGQPDPWFDSPWDCYWFNAAPDWGPDGPEGDPSLDRDDVDGAGPENTNLDSPEAGITYRIGVHYWDDHAHGESTATVRVWLHGLLVWEVVSAPLVRKDLWYVGRIDPATGEVFPCDEAEALPCLTPSYNHPLFGG